MARLLQHAEPHRSQELGAAHPHDVPLEPGDLSATLVGTSQRNARGTQHPLEDANDLQLGQRATVSRREQVGDLLS